MFLFEIGTNIINYFRWSDIFEPTKTIMFVKNKNIKKQMIVSNNESMSN